MRLLFLALFLAAAAALPAQVAPRCTLYIVPAVADPILEYARTDSIYARECRDVTLFQQSNATIITFTRHSRCYRLRYYPTGTTVRAFGPDGYPSPAGPVSSGPEWSSCLPVPVR